MEDKQMDVMQAMMPVGYPADRPGQKSRKPFQEVVSYDTY